MIKPTRLECLRTYYTENWGVLGTITGETNILTEKIIEALEELDNKIIEINDREYGSEDD